MSTLFFLIAQGGFSDGHMGGWGWLAIAAMFVMMGGMGWMMGSKSEPDRAGHTLSTETSALRREGQRR